MYAIHEGMKMVNKEVVDTFEREVTEQKVKFVIEAGTTGFKGASCII